MIEIAEYEIETFRRYRLDPERVRKCRCMLEGEPPLPMAEIRAHKEELETLRKNAEAAMHAMVEQDSKPELFWKWWIKEPFFEAEGEFGRWDLCEERWIPNGGNIKDLDASTTPTTKSRPTNLRPRARRRRRVSDCYAARPEKPEPLRAWNAFLVAFRTAPRCMIRLSPVSRGYQAEYVARNGDIFYFTEEDIRSSAQKSPTAEP